jgi:NAD(P)-dependent dehydrogenase (short-subunit alcohol dehydrogenase family)
MAAFANEVHASGGALDVLVNNAGVGLSGGIESTTLDDWEWILSVNVMGVVHGCHFFVPEMIRRGGPAHVVNVASALGLAAAPEILGYCTTKFAVVGLSESLRAELAPRGIGVSTICPGIVRTGIVGRARFRGERGERERARATDLFARRNYGPEKVARAILGAVQRDVAVRPVAPEAWAIYYIKRFVPWAGEPLGRYLTRRVRGSRTDTNARIAIR